MKIEMQKPKSKVSLIDGVHSGTIITYQTKTVEAKEKNKDGTTALIPYFDIIIETEGQEIQYSASQKLTPKSKLYKFVSAFGNIEAGTQFEMDSIINKKIRFRTITNENGFVEIVEGSVMPEWPGYKPLQSK